MKKSPAYYVPRERERNVQLIKNLRFAESKAAFEEVDENLSRDMHPSLLAELDWMEMTMPPEQRDDGARFVDDLFFHHLSALIQQRKVDFELPDAALKLDISANYDFYKNLLDDEYKPLNVLRPVLNQRIESLVSSEQPKIDEVVQRIIDEEKPAIIESFSGIEDRDWLLLITDAIIKNTLARSLDHLTSRYKTKQFIRKAGGQFPSMEILALNTRDDFKNLLSKLLGLASFAKKHGIYRLTAVCMIMHDLFKNMPLTKTPVFQGELGAGYGHCNRCSMMYASWAIISFDPTCPGLFQGERNIINLSLDFNIVHCPFCGEEERVESPSMFYSPGRNQVIYNFPLLGQFSRDEARQAHRTVIVAIRERYMQRINENELMKFKAATEEFTYGSTEFLYAIQMGTTVKEEHVALIVQTMDGSGFISDTTKGVLIGLTKSEMRQEWASARSVPMDKALEGNALGGGAKIKAAMKSYADGNHQKAIEILSGLLKDSPDDKVVKNNLAAVYIRLGQKENAKKIMQP